MASGETVIPNQQEIKYKASITSNVSTSTSIGDVSDCKYLYIHSAYSSTYSKYYLFPIAYVRSNFENNPDSNTLTRNFYLNNRDNSRHITVSLVFTRALGLSYTSSDRASMNAYVYAIK